MSPLVRLLRCRFALALVIGASACDDGTTPVGSGSPVAYHGPGTGGEQVTEAQGAATFTPAEVVSIMLVLNQSQIDQAQLAGAKAIDAETRMFAADVLAVHVEAAARLHTLQDALGSTADPTSVLLEREARLTVQALQAAEGTAFDFAYMTAQMTSQAKILGLIDVSLLPSAQAVDLAVNAAAMTALAVELRVFRASIVQHVVAALELQQALRSGAASSGRPGTGGPPGETRTGS